MIDRDMYDRQRDREIELHTRAFREWLRRQSRKSGADTDAGKTLYSALVRPLAERIAADQDAQAKSSRRYQRMWYQLAGDRPAEELAALTALHMLDVTINLPFNSDWDDIPADFDGIAFHNLVNAAFKLAEGIQRHIFWDDWMEATTAAQRERTERQVREQETDWARTKVYERAQEAAGIKRRDWEKKPMIDLGMSLIMAACEATEYFEIIPQPGGKKGKKKEASNALTMTVEGMEELRQHVRDLAETQRGDWPMIVEPVAWTNSRDGGYVINDATCLLFGPETLVGEQCRMIDAEPPTDVLDALNAAQAVSWRINESILREVLWHYRWHKLPHEKGETFDFTVMPRPSKPSSIEDRPAWKIERDRANSHNRTSISRLNSTRSMLKIAVDANQHDAVWFVHKLDKRGRLYPVTSGLAPQGSDIEKALLEFSVGKPLGSSGAFWLAVELANCWALDGIDKLPLDERVAWVEANQDLVLRSVSHTRDDDSPWKQAENPFGFLRAAYEWAGYLVEGESFVSHINVNMDGSNSGIQHYAALLRDPDSASKVCLTDTGPADIYQLVADETKRLIEDDLREANYKDKDEMVRIEWWLQHVESMGRKLVKQPGMTFTYSATELGMSKQLRKAAGNIGDPLKRTTDGRPTKPTCYALARRVNRAVRNVVERPAQAMEFLQTVCTELLSLGKRPQWVTPLGFPCLQNYYESTSRNKKVRWGGGQRKLESNYWMSQDTLKMRNSKHKASISPNFVHSMDSTHLMMTINRMADHGFEHLSIIHDSIGCHACDVDELSFAIRDEFYNLYGNSDWLADLQRQFEELAGTPLDINVEDRKQGSLDINCVKNSELFFA